MNAIWWAIVIAGLLPIVGIFVVMLLDDPGAFAFMLVVTGGIILAFYALAELGIVQ